MLVVIYLWAFILQIFSQLYLWIKLSTKSIRLCLATVSINWLTWILTCRQMPVNIPFCIGIGLLSLICLWVESLHSFTHFLPENSFSRAWEKISWNILLNEATLWLAKTKALDQRSITSRELCTEHMETKSQINNYLANYIFFLEIKSNGRNKIRLNTTANGLW